jgi:hypothetical protein
MTNRLVGAPRRRFTPPAPLSGAALDALVTELVTGETITDMEPQP